MFKRERVLSLAGAVVLTVALPIAMDQGYFRCNAYLLPILGLLTVLLYLAFFLMSNFIKRIIKQFYLSHRMISIITFTIGTIVVVGLLAMGEYIAIQKSKDHVKEFCPTTPFLPSSIPKPPGQSPKTKSIPQPQSSPHVMPKVPIKPSSQQQKAIETIPEVKKMLPPSSSTGRPFISASRNPIRICSNQPSEDFPRQGPGGLKIAVSATRIENDKQVVDGILSAVEGGHEYNLEKFTSIEIGTCMIHEIYSIEVAEIYNNYGCALFNVSMNAKEPCKPK